MTLSRKIFTQLTKILQLDWTQGDRLAFFYLRYIYPTRKIWMLWNGKIKNHDCFWTL